MAYHKVNVIFFILYIVAMTTFMIWQGIGITPDRYAIILILASLFVGKIRSFLTDWLPFLFILISYDFLRSLAPILNPRVHYQEMINFGYLIFGQPPTLILQKYFYHPGHIEWYDYFATFFYFLHFALPLSFAFILWLKNRHYFKRFTNALLILSYGAFVTYVIFPAAPPWLASEHGDLPGIVKILEITLKSFPQRLGLPTIYETFNPNIVAAVPSLHAAYPFLVLLFGLKFFGKKALYLIPYVIGVWVSIIYLGEHYFFDIILGVVYSLAAFYISQALFHLWQREKVKSFFQKFAFISPF